MYHYLD